MTTPPIRERDALCAAIEAAMAIADAAGNHLVAALLDEAHSAARCDPVEPARR